MYTHAHPSPLGHEPGLGRTLFRVAVAAALVAALIHVPPVHGAPTVVSGGTSAARVVAVGADVDPKSASVDLAMGEGGCKGVPLLSVACAAAAVGRVSACAEVDGTAGGFIPVKGTACASGGGGAYAAGTGSLWEEARTGHALVKGFYAPKPVKDHMECGEDYDIYEHGVHVKAHYCYWVYRMDQKVDLAEEKCADSNNWIWETQIAIQHDPYNPSSWVPGWHAKVCAAAAWLVGPYDCLEASAEAKASADLWEESADASLPSCSGGSSADNARDALLTAVDADVAVSGPDDVGFVTFHDPPVTVHDDGTIAALYEKIPKAGKSWALLPVSHLAPEDQVELRTALKQEFMASMESVLGPVDPSSAASDQLASPTAGMDMKIVGAALRQALDSAVDAGLAGDFYVEFQSSGGGGPQQG